MIILFSFSTGMPLLQIPFVIPSSTAVQREPHSGFPFQTKFIFVPHQSYEAKHSQENRWNPLAYNPLNLPNLPPPGMRWVNIGPGQSHHQKHQVHIPSYHQTQGHGVHFQKSGFQEPNVHQRHIIGVQSQNQGFHHRQEPNVRQTKVQSVQCKRPAFHQQQEPNSYQVPIQSVGPTLPQIPREEKKIVFKTFGDIDRPSWQNTLSEIIQKVPSDHSHVYTSNHKSFLKTLIDSFQLSNLGGLRVHIFDKESDRPGCCNSRTNDDKEAVRREWVKTVEMAGDLGKSIVDALMPTDNPSKVYNKPQEAKGRPEIIYNQPAEVYNTPREHAQVYNKPTEATARPAVGHDCRTKVFIKPTITTTEKIEESQIQDVPPGKFLNPSVSGESISNPVEVEKDDANRNEETVNEPVYEVETTDEKTETTSEAIDNIEKVTKKPTKDNFDELENEAAKQPKENHTESAKKPISEEVDNNPSDDEIADDTDYTEEDEEIKNFKEFIMNQSKRIADEEKRKLQKDLEQKEVKAEESNCTCVLAQLCQDQDNVYGVGSLDMR